MDSKQQFTKLIKLAIEKGWGVMGFKKWMEEWQVLKEDRLVLEVRLEKERGQVLFDLLTVLFDLRKVFSESMAKDLIPSKITAEVYKSAYGEDWREKVWNKHRASSIFEKISNTFSQPTPTKALNQFYKIVFEGEI